MRKDNRAIIVLTVVMIIILIINIMDAQNTCNYIIKDSSLKCITIETFGLTDILYFIGKNLYIIIYAIILMYTFRKRKISINNQKTLVEENKIKKIVNNQAIDSLNKENTNVSYTLKDIYLYIFIICMIIAAILLSALLIK